MNSPARAPWRPRTWDLYAVDQMRAPHDPEVGQPLGLSRSDTAALAAARRAPRALRALTRATARVRQLTSRT
jgi:hypothetical protein